MPVNKRWPLAELIATMEVGGLGRCEGMYLLASVSGWRHAWQAAKLLNRARRPSALQLFRVHHRASIALAA